MAILLTIDDAPSEGFVEKLSAMQEYGISSILFCIGRDIVRNKAILFKALEQGHIIGNHTQNHPWFSATSLTECLNEIEKGHESLLAFYKEAQTTPPQLYFRFPYGDVGDGKYGKHHYSFSEARQSMSFSHYWPLLQWRKLKFKLKDWQLGYFKAEEMANKADTIQNKLKALGYDPPNFLGIHHAFYARYQYDHSTQCTYDNEDWRYRDNALETYIKKLKTDLDQKIEEDVRGILTGNLPLRVKQTDHILLSHDYSNNNEIFRRTLEIIRQADLPFASPWHIVRPPNTLL